jgi:NitT/TauT family transport system substrate-binding protein
VIGGENRVKLSRREFLVTLAGAGLGLVACSPTGAPAPKPAGEDVRRVSVRFNWSIKGEFAPFFVAIEKGFYREANLEVEPLEGKSGTQAVQVVGTGNDHFGYVPSIQVFQGINQGIPVKTVAAFGRWTGMCWVSWPDIPLKGPKDLEGRRVSISSASTFFQVWPAFARKFNVDVGKVQVVSADPSARVGLFLRRELDIMADIFIANDYVIIREQVKQPLNLLKLSDLNFDVIGYLLIANKNVLNDGELVSRFVRATIKGFRYMLDHPAEAAEIMSRRFGDRLSPEVFRGQVEETARLISTTPAVGQVPPDAWDDSLRILYEAGVIDKVLPLREYFTDEFVRA